MVKKSENGVPIPPFLMKCYEMVDDRSSDALISWGSSDDSFVIWDVTGFASELLPKYFKHNTFSSFIRQLNLYGFRKIETDSWEFANDCFIKGQKHLLKNIVRRKQSHGLVQRKSSEQKDKDVGACEDNKNVGLWKEVESLKIDKNVLMQELVMLRKHQETSHSKVLLLREQLKGMEKNQQQMLSFIVMAMQSPGFLVQLLQPKENNWHMTESGKNILKQDADDCEPAPTDGMIVRYQPPADEAPEPLHTPSSNSENLLELDLSSEEVKDLFMNIDFMSGSFDEKPTYSESYEPIILPALPDDDGMMEQLLSSPFLETNGYTKLSTENPTDAAMDMETTFYKPEPRGSDEFKFVTAGLEKSQDLNMETTVFDTQLDNSQNMEILTKKMENSFGSVLTPL